MLDTLDAVQIAELARRECAQIQGVVISGLSAGDIIRVRIPNSRRVYLFEVLDPILQKMRFVRWNPNKPSKVYRSGSGVISPELTRGQPFHFRHENVLIPTIREMSVFAVS